MRNSSLLTPPKECQGLSFSSNSQHARAILAYNLKFPTFDHWGYSRWLKHPDQPFIDVEVEAKTPSNKYTRVISEKLGHKFEDIAALSPHVFVPDRQIGFNLKGIDIIVFLNDKSYIVVLR